MRFEIKLIAEVNQSSLECEIISSQIKPVDSGNVDLFILAKDLINNLELNLKEVDKSYCIAWTLPNRERFSIVLLHQFDGDVTIAADKELWPEFGGYGVDYNHLFPYAKEQLAESQSQLVKIIEELRTPGKLIIQKTDKM